MNSSNLNLIKVASKKVLNLTLKLLRNRADFKLSWTLFQICVAKANVDLLLEC